jgi:hypothetical protein
MKVVAALLACLLFGLSGCDMDSPTGPGDPSSFGDILINEILASNDTVNQDPDHSDFADWLELYNKGTAREDIGDWTISDGGNTWTIPAGTTVPAGGYLIIWCDSLDEVGIGLHSNFKLSSGGETVTLLDDTGQHRDSHEFGPQTTDVAIGRSPDGADNWVTIDPPTPGAANTGSASYGLFINEFLASNDTDAQDPDHADFSDWIELYNETTGAIDISGWTMTDDLADPEKWTVPSGTAVPAGGYLVIWADGLDEVGLGIHAGFKLSGGGEQIGLYDLGAAPVDTLTYGAQTTDVSYGRLPDGSDTWTTFDTPTPGAENAASASYGLFINEFLASNDAVNQDPDFGEFGDWIEIYNETAGGIDIGGWTMTDDLADPGAWTVPAGTTVPAGGFLLIWADNADTLGLGIHTNFKLGSGGEQIGLYDLGAAPVDTLTYVAQETDVSSGRLPDGSNTWATFGTPTPGASNN